jgi:PAS domain S-box-containing protein
VHADVSDRRWAELELSDSDDRWRKFADQLPVLMWLREPNTDKIHVNRFGLEMTGWPVEDFTLAKWIAAIHPADLKRELPRFRAAQATREKYMFEYRYRHASGEYRWVLDCGVPRFQRDGTFLGYGGILIDIQARKQAERERTDLAGRLLRAQEAERSRIARELHDDIAQRIALLAICMENLEENGAGNGNGGDSALRQLRRDAKQLSLDVSHLSHQLHSSYLEHLGLAAAVEHQCKELAAVHGVRIDCRIDALRRPFEHDVALSLFRVLQEALRNALRHADPTRITVELHADRRAVRLCVVDDGVGFDPRAVDGEGLGLASMRERLRLLGGEIAIVSKHRGGTRVEATVPHAHQKFAPARAGDRHAASRTS